MRTRVLHRCSRAAMAHAGRTAPPAMSGLPQTSTTPIVAELSGILEEQLEGRRSAVRSFLKAHGDRAVGQITASQVIGGMRGVLGLAYETSQLDPAEGIRYRGYSIPEFLEQLPKPAGSGYPATESVLWLLLTGTMPTAAQAEALQTELAARAEAMPATASKALGAVPPGTHPMTQFAMGVLALQPESVFARAYRGGAVRSELWRYTLEDTLSCLAYLPNIAAQVYQQSFRKGAAVVPPSPGRDWAARFAGMVADPGAAAAGPGQIADTPLFADCMRLYMAIHADHEGGNVSAHASHLVGSALADPYLSFAAALTGLAGPLHGLAIQEVMRWTRGMVAQHGLAPTHEDVRAHAWETLRAGKVIPGFGHAVLRATDPRYTALQEFAAAHLPDDPHVAIVRKIYETVPDVLAEHGKSRNPWPNVDAHSGVLFNSVGLVEEDYYTVLFGLSRAVGVLSAQVWSRGLGFPIERPKSAPSAWIEELVTRTT